MFFIARIRCRSVGIEAAGTHRDPSPVVDVSSSMSRSIELSKFQFASALGIHLNLVAASFVIVSNFTHKSNCFLLISIQAEIDNKLRINPIVNHDCNPSEYS
jgi:hypothetical protein